MFCGPCLSLCPDGSETRKQAVRYGVDLIHIHYGHYLLYFIIITVRELERSYKDCCVGSSIALQTSTPPASPTRG